MSLDSTPICYLALDLDDALLRTDKSISSRTRATADQAVTQDYYPVIATARPPCAAEALLDGFLPDAPRIYYSGSRICIGTVCYLNRTIPSSTAYRIVDDFLDRAPRATLAQITHADVSKSDTIRRVVERSGHVLSSVITFGDDTNNIEMIRAAGIGVAMANAVSPVKSVADHVTLSNDKDGVAIVIETLLLK